MMLFEIFPVLLLACHVAAAPTSDEDVTIITKDFFPDEFVVYTSKHDIVDLTVPLNALNFDEDSDDDDTQGEDAKGVGLILFFTEADITDKVEYKGLYSLTNGTAKKILDNGRVSTAANDDSKQVFFGAADGLYVYDYSKNTAVKYGSFSEPIKAVAKANSTDIIYVNTDNGDTYKIENEGTKITKLDDIKTDQLVLDFSDNLYYYGNDKLVYVASNDGTKKIAGLPAGKTKLIRPAFVIENGVPVLVDDRLYIAYANGTSEKSDFIFRVQPTAFAPEATLIQYYAIDKKIYEYNVLVMLFSETIAALKEFLDGQKSTIEVLATRSRNDLRA